MYSQVVVLKWEIGCKFYRSRAPGELLASLRKMGFFGLLVHWMISGLSNSFSQIVGNVNFQDSFAITKRALIGEALEELLNGAMSG